MSVQVRWDGDNHARIIIQIEASWTWKEIWDAREACVDMMKAVAPTSVNVIVDQTRGSNWFPGGYWSNVRRILFDIPDNTGKIIIVSDNQIVQQLFEIFARFRVNVGFDYGFATTVDDARNMLDGQ